MNEEIAWGNKEVHLEGPPANLCLSKLGKALMHQEGSTYLFLIDGVHKEICFRFENFEIKHLIHTIVIAYAHTITNIQSLSKVPPLFINLMYRPGSSISKAKTNKAPIQQQGGIVMRNVRTNTIFSSHLRLSSAFFFSGKLRLAR